MTRNEFESKGRVIVIMCGFVAVLLHGNLQFSEEHLEEIKENTQRMKHRGLDEEAYFHDDHIALGFQGAHINELENRQQPFHFADDRYCLVFNGRIYNKNELRDQLVQNGYIFETESAIEVIATLFLEKGVDAFTQLRGMFSILIWDSLDHKIYGARDQFGIKPLYYMESEEETIFASEKKSMLFSDDEEIVNSDAFQYYLTYQYVPEPMTLTAGILKIKPGHYFVKEINEPIKLQRYFHATFRPADTDYKQVKDAIRATLIDSVNVHMKSDAPVGSLLSGGIDSSLIVALAKEVNPNIKTFSVGFGVEGYSEIDAAKRTAEHLNVENISYTITAQEYIDKLPEIMWHMDDPLADPSCVPLYFAAREARKHVKVVLSGEGADELFGGYNIYREPESLKVFQMLPGSVNNALHRIAAVFPEGMRGKSFLERGTTPLEDRYIGNAKMFEEDDKREILKSYNMNIPYQTVTKNLYDNISGDNAVHKMQYIDINTWLPGDILLKADKMSQAHSLELRIPFLDKEVFNVARTIPVHEKIANGTTKSILREAFRGMVPDEVLYRKKLGFPVPIKHWLKEEIYLWARQLINASETDHLINKAPVLHLLERHRKNKGDHARKIWTVLMFMLWHQIYIEQKTPL